MPSCTCCSERHLFYALLLFWFVGVLLLAIEHPHNCKFFDLPPPGSGKITPTNPHEDPEADWFYTFSHKLSLPSYALLGVLLQLVLFTAWYAQLANHDYLQSRSARERERGRRMAQYGWGRCIRSVFRDSDEIEDDTLPPDAQRLECVCGCCCCFSTSCTLWIFNLSTIAGLAYLLVLGSGTLESSSRFSQNPECRVGVPALVYILVLHAALVVLYLVLIAVQICCKAKSVVQGVVMVGKKFHNRVATRRARKGQSARGAGAAGGGTGNSAYAKLAPPLDAELGLELSEDEDTESMGGPGVEVEMGDDEWEELFGAAGEGGSNTQRSGASEIQLVLQPKPHRPSAAQLLSSPSSSGYAAATIAPPPSASSSSLSSVSRAPPPPMTLRLDDDSRAMMMLLDGAGGDAGHCDLDGEPSSAAQLQLEHQLRAEAALDLMERELENDLETLP